MAKPAHRPYSAYNRNAVKLLGQLIRQGRIDKKLTAEDLAERTGVSRGLIQRIEKGDPGCTIGAVFEAASIVGVPLFDADRATLAREVATRTAMLTLLPKAVRLSRSKAKDDF